MIKQGWEFRLERWLGWLLEVEITLWPTFQVTPPPPFRRRFNLHPPVPAPTTVPPPAKEEVRPPDPPGGGIPAPTPVRSHEDASYRLPPAPQVNRLLPAGAGRSWLLPRMELTPEQLAMVEAPVDRHRLVTGFPGSGKTQVLVHRADHLRRRFQAAPDSFRIFLYTNVLRDYIRSALDLLDLPHGAVCTFDAWCHDFYAANISRGRPPSRRGRPDFERVRFAVLEFVARHGPPGEPLEFVLVDEGQDLPAEAYRILLRVARHITVVADPHQQIYERGATLEEIREALGIPAAAAHLLGAYRNSPLVSRLAARFIDDPAERARYLAQGMTVQKVKERPLLFFAPTFTAEMDRLAEVVRSRQELNQRVGILAPNAQQVDRVTTALGARGVEVEKAVAPPAVERAAGRTWVRFDSATPKVVGLHGAKGLTFDCVCLAGLTPEAFEWMPSVLRRRLLFTSIARATQWAYFSATGPDILPELKFLLEAAQEGLLTIQRAVPPAPAPPAGDEYSLL